MATSKRLSKRCIRQMLIESLSDDDITDARTIVGEMVDMHEKAFALYAAVKTSRLEAVQAFLDAGSDPFLKHNGCTALVVAAQTDNIKCLQTLLKPYLPVTKHSSTEKEGQRLLYRVKRAINEALFESAVACSKTTLAYLLDIGADCDTYCYHDDEFLSWCTPLIAASYGPLTKVGGHISKTDAIATVDMLVSHGADVNKVNHAGDTPIHWACGAALSDSVSLLLRNGADINRQNTIGKTPLMTLAEMTKYNEGEYLKIAEVLIRHGADITLTDHDGWTALFFAIEARFGALVQLLLKSGADPNKLSTEETNRVSPLTLSVINYNQEILWTLLQWNADPNINPESSPFSTACEWLNTEAADALYLAGTSHAVITRVLDNLPALSTTDGAFWTALRSKASTPAYLTLLCRTVIRKALGPSLPTLSITDLPIPVPLQAYIRLEN